jgi:hypothetical protein
LKIAYRSAWIGWPAVDEDWWRRVLRLRIDTSHMWMGGLKLEREWEFPFSKNPLRGFL